MKYIYVQPAIKRFEWELLGSIKSLTDLGVPYSDIILLFTSYDDSVTKKFRDMSINVFSYFDSREDKEYIPSVRPFLWYKFLKENPMYEDETFAYLDSDVVITDLKAFDVNVQSDKWFGSDTNGYLGYEYLQSITNSESTINKMIEAHGDVTLDFVKNIKIPGAQWVIKNPTQAYWKDVYDKSISIYKATKPIDTSLQKWTAEMWAQAWTLEKHGIEPIIHDNLRFLFATDEINDDIFIIHNAGVVDDNNDMGLFFKGKFQERPKESDLITNPKYAQSIYLDKVKSALY